MSVGDALRLEARVAFSRKAQPIWFRVLKWTIAIGAGWYFRHDPRLWWWIAAAFGTRRVSGVQRSGRARVVATESAG